MATTTPNFGWPVPTSTDLVKDGATAIESLGDSIDASLLDLKGGTSGQVLKKNSNTDMDFIWSADSAGMTNPMTTTGDIIYSSSGSTPARLGIGTTGQVLNVTGGVPAWTTPAAGGGMTLLSTTTLSGASTTVSSISGSYKDLIIHVNGMQTAATSYAVYFKPNNSGSISSAAGVKSQSATSSTEGYASSNIAINRTGDFLGSNSTNAFTIRVYNYASADAVKNYQFASQFQNSSGNIETKNEQGGIQTSSAITSWVTATDASSFNAGTIKIYGVN